MVYYMFNAMSRLSGASAQKHIFASARAHYLAYICRRRRHMLSSGKTATQKPYEYTPYIYIYKERERERDSGHSGVRPISLLHT